MPKSPIVEVVDVLPEEIDRCGDRVQITFKSSSGKRVYYVFVPFSLIVDQCRDAGIVFIGRR